MEREDLPTTVGEEFVCPNRTLAYSVDVIRRLSKLVKLGGYCRRSALPLTNLAYLLAGDRLL
jgi:hypothetical protein